MAQGCELLLFPEKTAFEQYLEDNPNVWKLFVRFTEEVIAAGRKRFSADSVLHRIRWYTNFETTDRPYKINNNWSADFARKFMEENPKYKGFFELRERKK